MAIGNPQDHKSKKVRRVLPHSGNLGLERPVKEFDRTSLKQAVDQDLLNPLPDALDHPDVEIKTKKTKSKGKIATAAGAVVLAAGAAIFAIGGGSGAEKGTESSTQTSSSAGPITPPSVVAPPLSPTTAETLPFGSAKPELVLPSSNDPNQLATALYANQQNYVNTGDINFLDYDVVDSNSELGNQMQLLRQKVADQQLGNYPGAHSIFKSITVLDAPTFSAQDTQRVMTTQFVEEVYLDDGGEPYDIFTHTRRLTLDPVTRASNKENEGPVTVWLISQMDDLGDTQIK